MRRRAFLGLCVSALCLPLARSARAASVNKTFVVTYRSRNGQVGRDTIMASDAGAAVAQVKKKYPGTTILSVQQR